MNSSNFPALQKELFALYNGSNVKQYVSYKEYEVVTAGKIDYSIRLDARVNKSKEMNVRELQEAMYEVVSEHINSEEATKFLNESFPLNVGLSVGDKFDGIEVNNVQDVKEKVIHNSGEVLMIDFWATWCGYCQEPFQHTIDMSNNNPEIKKKNIRIIGVSRDEKVDAWKAHIADKKWDVIPHYNRADITAKLGIPSIPQIVIIDKKGVVVFIGHPDLLNIEQALLDLADDKPLRKKHDDLVNQNAWFSEKDKDAKLEVVSKVQTVINEGGAGKNTVFAVRTTFVHDSKNSLKSISEPIFYGEVSPYEYDNLHQLAQKIETEFSFKNFKYQVKVLQISADVDF